MNETTKNYEGSIDFEVTYVSEEDATGRMPVQAGILNPFGTVHAGAMIWFADVVATTLALQGVAPVEGMTGFPPSHQPIGQSAIELPRRRADRHSSVR